MKKCTICKKQKPKEVFRVKADGNLQSRCKPCELQYLREYRKKNKERLRQYHREYYNEAKQIPAWLDARREQNKQSMRRMRAKHPDREREYKKRQWAKLKADPKRYVQYLEDRRMYWHLARERRGGDLESARKMSTAKMSKFEQIRLDAGPLQAWLREYGNMDRLAIVTGMDADQLRRIFKQEFVSFDVADRILTREGSTAMHELWS